MNGVVIPTVIFALVLFYIGSWSVRCSRSQGRRTGLLVLWFLLGLPGFLITLYYLHWFDNARWFYAFRSIPYTELMAAGAGLFAGALSEVLKGAVLLSRPVMVVLLCIGIAGPYMKPVLQPVPADQFEDRWQDDVCLQSTVSTCGAASAATIFRFFGIDAGEREIAVACYTYYGGTENWYLARAFRERGLAVHYRIEPEFPSDLQLPAIAGVRVRGCGHFIAITEKSGGAYRTGDPLIGPRWIASERIAKEIEFTGFFMEVTRDESGE